MAYWVAVATDSAIWAQTGFEVVALNPPILEYFVQIWDLNTDTVLVTVADENLLANSPGLHTFQIVYNPASQSNWDFLLDGSQIYDYDMGNPISAAGPVPTTNSSTNPYPPIQVLMEQQNATWNEVIPITFNTVLQAQQNGKWNQLESASLFTQFLGSTGLGYYWGGRKHRNSIVAE